MKSMTTALAEMPGPSARCRSQFVAEMATRSALQIGAQGRLPSNQGLIW